MSYQQHSSYYCRDLVLLVENTLFRVPRFVFQDSEVFQDMLSVPQGEGTSIEGSDDAHPLVLSSYLAHDFEQLMKVLLPQSYPPTKPKLSSADWMSVIKLATVWNLEHVRQTAIEELDGYGAADPVLRLIVAKKYNIPRWFVPAVNQLARRKEPLNSQDLERLQDLGSLAAVCKFILGVGHVRESLQFASTSPTSNCQFNSAVYCYTHSVHTVPTTCHTENLPIPANREDHDFTAEICRVFECVEENSVLVPKSSLWDFT